MRQDHTKLPSKEELEKIFATEAKRPLPIGKKDKHYVTLEPLIGFLKLLDFDSSFIEMGITPFEARERGDKFSEQILPIILNFDHNQMAKIGKDLYAYLEEEDTPEYADLIFAFGSKANARAEKAAELYKKGLGKKVMFCGGNPLYVDGEMPEAERYKEIALSLSVPEEDIIVENKSITIPDNIRSSLNLLDELAFEFKTLILVNSPYSQRRGWAGMKKYTKEGTMLYRVNCIAREGLNAEDWFTNKDGINYVINEYRKMWVAYCANDA